MIDDQGVDGGDRPTEQLSQADTLLSRGLVDVLDEGYSPPDRPSAVRVPTLGEQSRGPSLDELLGAEVPDIGAFADGTGPEEDGGNVGLARSGRLVFADGAADSDVLAIDVGIDGAGASAEEAAMHTIDTSLGR